MKPVNSWNEWDPLKEVVVGVAQGAADLGYEPAFSPYYQAGSEERRFRGGPVHPELLDAAARQLDHFAELLAGLGITVQRPDPVDHARPYATPDWGCFGGHAAACPRDLLLVVGEELIEAPMAQRGRYFEFRAYRRLLKDYFRRGARWTAAPKPEMADALYADCEPEGYDFSATPLLTDFEPAFDAACITRCGRDLFWRPDLVSNAFGAAWLQRHLGPGFRVHRAAFREPLPTHIDTTLVPIRPGLALVNPSRPCLDGTLELFRTNGWELVEAPASVRTGRAPSRDVSNWISMNILMLDERTAVVEEAEKPMMELLRSLGCEAVPCPFERVYPLGGGFHCCTSDIRRDGELKSYFPTLD